MSERTRKQVSAEVAQRLGLTRNYLTTYILRHPELRPAERLPNGDYLWSESEIQAVSERRQRKRRAGAK
jgi:predicted DNA-binding transcriptional regulator AlpA